MTFDLNKARKQAGMRWEDVANELGCDIGHARDVANGLIPAGSLAKPIAEMFSVPVADVHEIRPTPTQLSNWVKKMQRVKGFSASRLATLAGVPGTTVTDILKKRPVPDEEVQAVVDAALLNDNSRVLREAREKGGITLEDAAYASGLPLARVAAAERGEAALHQSEMERLVRSLSPTPEDEEATLRALGAPRTKLGRRKAKFGSRLRAARTAQGWTALLLSKEVGVPVAALTSAEAGWGDGSAIPALCKVLDVESPFGSPIEGEFSEWLQKTMSEDGVATSRVAALSDMPLRAVEDILAGRAKPSLWTQKAIREALGKPELERAGLRTFRHWARLDQRALSRKSGVPASVISEIETGKRFPNSKTINALAGALGVSPSDILVPDVSGVDLYRRRTAIGATQADLYRASGIPRYRISQHELGHLKLEDWEMDAIRAALDDMSGVGLREKFRNTRIDLGMTQQGVAQAIGTSSTLLSQFETGKRRATPAVRKKMERFVEKHGPGDRLRRLRQMGHMSREELADAAGCSVSHLADVESGASRPSERLAATLAKVIGESVTNSLLRDFLEEKGHIQTLRIKRGLTQEEVASAVGCSPSHVSLVERGLATNSPHAHAILAFLNDG